MNESLRHDTAVVPPVVRTATVARTPPDAFAVFTDQIGAWWPLPTHGVFGDRSGGLRFHAGHLVETATDGTPSVWAEVLDWDPPDRFSLAWHPGRADGPASRVDVVFEADGVGTRVTIRHHGWEAFGEEGLARRRGLVGPSTWGHVLDHFADVAEPIDEAIDLDALADAYDAFWAVAERGDFGPAPEGEWDAAQIVAHVALNDLAMSAVTHALVHGNEPSFENHTCQERSNLAAVIERCGDTAELISWGRTCATHMMAGVRRLDTKQQQHLVPCRLEHDGNVVLDEARPWTQIAVQIQAGMHLPAHTDQLEALRT